MKLLQSHIAVLVEPWSYTHFPFILAYNLLSPITLVTLFYPLHSAKTLVFTSWICFALLCTLDSKYCVTLVSSAPCICVLSPSLILFMHKFCVFLPLLFISLLSDTFLQVSSFFFNSFLLFLRNRVSFPNKMSIENSSLMYHTHIYLSVSPTLLIQYLHNSSLASVLYAFFMFMSLHSSSVCPFLYFSISILKENR